jgi:hypothetical protein
MQMTNPGALTSAAGILRIDPSRRWYLVAGLPHAGAVCAAPTGTGRRLHGA